MGEFEHEPVLVREMVSLFAPLGEGVFVDGTVGGGGFADALLAASDERLIYVGLDVDPEAIRAASLRLGRYGQRVVLMRRNFRLLEEVLQTMRVAEVVGAALDCGVSSHQLAGDRGLSFQRDAPLDMRLDPDQPVTAASLLRDVSEPRLTALFRELGELPRAARLAAVVKAAVAEGRMRRALDLAAAVRSVLPGGGTRALATAFQAVRMAVNSELDNLGAFLSTAPRYLRHGARLAVISFHSGEDRLTKQTFRGLVQEGHFAAVTRKAIRPGPDEVARNPRSRSARLRAVERSAP